MWTEIILILIFILLNGFFSGSEIAVVSVRKTRIDELVRQGSRSAKLLQALKVDPDRFFATVQIGVTFVGAMASAIGGAAAVESLKPLLQEVPVGFIAASSEAIAIGFVVILITFFSLVFGELVPKSLALRSPERFSLIIARPLYSFSRFFSLFVNLLTTSTNVVIRFLGGQPVSHMGHVTEEEIKLLIREGRDRGYFEAEEERLIHSVFEFTDLSAKEIMVPIAKVVAFSMDTAAEELLLKANEEQFSRYPVYAGEKSNIKGILYVKDLFKKVTAGEPLDMRKLLRTPYFVPESMKISSLLRQMQRKTMHIAIVVDEYGAVSGIVTIEDILEEIVGEIRDEYDVEQPVITLKDGSYLIDASITIRDLKEDHGIYLPESMDYDTVGGFIIAHLQRIPAKGEVVLIDGWSVEIVRIVDKRLERVILKKHEYHPDRASSS